ncbi:hAT dimerisation domain-containing protein / transposase-related [Striga hermonthica]|uniref:HAT dimerisation domain-containing protein / transposase-related n=1 Tax=Striga hermonthica TaxID=68872 RepID=A0A9N7RP83_STRHE|nr:hAT dimerisation domain-containing protein / transposase-related [Striga hermonthica]
MCTKVPSDVKEEMIKLLSKKIDNKQRENREKEDDRVEVDLSHSEGEEHIDVDGNSVVVLKKVTSKGASSGGPMDKYCKMTPKKVVAARKGKSGVAEKVQSKISTEKRKEKRDRAFYSAYGVCFLDSVDCSAVKKDGRVLDLMRKFLSRDLVRCGVTRFATAYHNLKSLLENKKELQRLFRDDELSELGYLKSAKGKKANNVVKFKTFWKGVETVVHYFEPLAIVLRRIDSDVPAMGFWYGYLVEAKNEISRRFNNDRSKFEDVFYIIDKRWDKDEDNEITGIEPTEEDLEQEEKTRALSQGVVVAPQRVERNKKTLKSKNRKGLIPTFEHEESSPSSDGEDDNDIDMLSSSGSEDVVVKPYSPY